MTPEEEFNFANFVRLYVETRLEATIKHGVAQLNRASIPDDSLVDFTVKIQLTGKVLKMILSGELEPHMAVRMLSMGLSTVPGNVNINLDKDPNDRNH